MIRLDFPADSIAALDPIVRTTDHAKLRHRVQIVLLAHRGRPHGEIATDLGCSRRSVQRWLNADREGGLDGLRPRKARGGKPKLTPELVPVLQQGGIDGPAKHGLDRANGTDAERADHLFQVRGIRVRKSALQAFGAKHGIRPYRPTDRFLRGDPTPQPKFGSPSRELRRLGPPTAERFSSTALLRGCDESQLRPWVNVHRPICDGRLPLFWSRGNGSPLDSGSSDSRLFFLRLTMQAGITLGLNCFGVW
jgi:transposase